MLSSAQQRLIEQDSQLSGLRVLLDIELLAKELNRQCPELQIDNITPVYLRYKPGMNCIIKYQACSGGEQIQFYAKTFARKQELKLEKSYQRYTRARRKWQNARMLPSLVLHHIATIIHFFCVDNKLKNIAMIADSGGIKRLLKTLFPAQTAIHNNARLNNLRYKPERRYVARLDNGQKPVAVLKFYTPSNYKNAKKAGTSVYSGKQYKVPALIAHDDKNHILAFEWLPSKSLNELIQAGVDVTDAISKAGVALAEMHKQKSSITSHLERTAEIEELQATAVAIGETCPNLAEQTQQLAGRLVKKLQSLEAKSTVIHGDFYADQVLLLNDNSIGLIDFDRAALGEPARDIGNFAAHLIHDALDNRIAIQVAEKYIKVFSLAYQQQQQKMSQLHLELYTAIGLFHQLMEPFRSCLSDWEPRIQSLLDHIKQLLDDDNSNVSRNKDKVMPYIEDALNVSTMQAKLSALFQQHRQGELVLHQACLTRHKPGRRCLIEYSITVNNKHQVLIGKIRARGLDKRTWQVHQQLIEKGFDSNSDDGISVPEPMGLVPEFNMWLYKKVDGEPVNGFFQGQDNHKLAVKIAHAIHKLHHSDIKTDKSHSFSDEMAILKQRLELLGTDKPHWQQRLKHLLMACQELIDRMPEQRVCGIHRDFYFDQLIYDNNCERIHLIDLDLYCQSHPVIDIGNFIAHIMEFSLRQYGDIHAQQELTDSIKNRVLELSTELDSDSIEACVSLALVRLMQISTQFIERRAFTKKLLQICEQRLGLFTVDSLSKNKQGFIRQEIENSMVLGQMNDVSL